MIRKAIPSKIRRQVRQKCGFGCVLCGCPICDYEHIDQYSEVKEHSCDNLVLLCPNCHRKKTNGIITKSMVRDALSKATKRTRTGSDDIPVELYTMDIGGNEIAMFSGTVFDIHGFGILSLTFNKNPMINADFYDENGNTAIQIRENVYTLSSRVWDIEIVGKTLTFRNKPRDIFCSITINSDSKKIFFRGSIMFSNGIRLKITDRGIFANKKLLASSNRITKSRVGILISDQELRHPFLALGSVSNSIFQNISGIAVFNSENCKGNIIGECEVAFFWKKHFIENHLIN